MQGSQVCQWNKYKILFSFNAVKFHRYNTELAGVCTLVVQCRGSSLRMNDPRVSSLSQAPSEVGLRWREPGAEMRRAMVSGIVTGDAPVSSKNPRSLCES